MFKCMTTPIPEMVRLVDKMVGRKEGRIGMARLGLSDLHGRESVQGIISSIKRFVFYFMCKWKILRGSKINRIMFLKDHYECLEETGF